MRIGHVANSLAVGGTERQLQSTALALRQRHSDLAQHLYLTRYQASDGLAQEIGADKEKFTIQAMQKLDEESGEPQASETLAALARNVHARRAIRYWRIQRYIEVFRADRLDGVIFWKPELAGAIAAVMADVPSILFRAGSIAPVFRPHLTEREIFEYDFMTEAFRFLSRYPSVRFVANSMVARNQFISAMHWPEERSGVLYNYFDPARFAVEADKAASRAVLGLPPDRIIVGGAFRLSPEKRIRLWLDAAAQLACRTDVHFAIAGGGRLLHQARRHVDDKGLGSRISLLGEVHGNIPHFYNAIDILLHTSAFEGLPNSVVEAQSFGVPVVATDAGGTKEAFIPGLTGELVDIARPAEIAAALSKTISSLEDGSFSKERCKEFVGRRFSLEALLRNIEAAMNMKPSHV